MSQLQPSCGSVPFPRVSRVWATSASSPGVGGGDDHNQREPAQVTHSAVEKAPRRP